MDPTNDRSVEDGDELKKSIMQYKLRWNLLNGIRTPGGKNFRGTEKGFVGQIYKACEKIRC